MAVNDVEGVDEGARLPRQMKAAAIEQLGGPEVVHVETVPVPRPGPREVLIEVASAGVGVWDPPLIRGDFSDGVEGFPRIIGADGAGTVAAVGGSVTRFKAGDRVYGYGFGNPKGGFFAEYAAIPEERLAHVPPHLSLDQAGALAVSGLAALEGIEALGVKEGNTVCIIGASGGVGHIAVQLAKLMGMRVFAVASGQDGVRLATRLGADGVVEGKHHDVAGAARAFSPGGYDGALVFAGRADGWRDVLSLVHKHGVVAYPNGVDPVPHGTKRVELKAFDAETSPDAFARLNALVERGPFHVELSRTYALADAAQALHDVTTHHLGKLALRIH